MNELSDSVSPQGTTEHHLGPAGEERNVLGPTIRRLRNCGEFYLARRILSQIASGLQCSFTLLCAPAGYGKTTGLRLALGACGRPVFWLPLKKEHNHPEYFLSEVHRLLRHEKTKAPPPGLSAHESVSALIQAMNGLSGDASLVLDDYHMIQSEVVHEAVNHLINHNPPGFHLYVSTRSDPPFALSKKRLLGEVIELRTVHLAFTEKETAGLLAYKTGEEPDSAVIRKIWQQCEGWPALICLLAHSFKDEPFSKQAGQKAIHSYVEEEIICQLSPVLRDFLLKTCLFEQLSIELCTDMLAQPSVRESFEALVRDQLLLPTQTGFYRYHPVIADFLKAKPSDQSSTQRMDLHREAARWFERHGLLHQAVEHDLQGGNGARAVENVLCLGWETLQKGDADRVLSWCNQLEHLIGKPVREVAELKGFALLQEGKLEEAERVLNDLATVRAVLASAMIARYYGQYETVERVASTALMSSVNLDSVLRCQIELQLGMARLYDRRVLAAEQILSQALNHAEYIGHLHLILATTIALSAVFHNRGDYDRSIAMLERSLVIGGKEVTAETISTRLRMGQLLLETGHFTKASEILEKSLRDGERIVSPEVLAYGYIIHARKARVEGNLTQAAEDHQIANGFAPKGGLMSRANLAERMLLYLVSGEIAVVESWAADEGLIPEKAEYTGDERYLVFARLLLRINHFPAAVQTLEKMLLNARENDWGNAILQILPWLALAQYQAGDLEKARITFQEALFLSSKHRYCLAFLEVYKEFPWVFEALLNFARMQGCEIDHITHVVYGDKKAGSKIPETRYTPPRPRSDCFEIRLFGAMRVFCGGKDIVENGWRTERVRDLLAYLAVNYDNPTPIEILLEQLWPGRPLKETRRLFHTTLYYLRRTLLPAGEKLELISHRSGNYALNQRHFWTDVQVFDELVTGFRDREKLTAALELAKGPCLMGFFTNWAVDIQREYDQRVIRALSDLAGLCAITGDLAEATAYVEKALRMDPLDESLVCQLIEWYRLQGNRSAAISCFETLRQNLAKELDVEPTAETLALVNRIRFELQR